jgi:hypothetical protein
LSEVQAAILSSSSDVAAWELRQFPHEHPKVYSPATGYTTWCSAAALVIKRSAFEEVRGFDEKIFMYAEDVDLSWRLRARGYNLKYIPQAIVKHYTYEAGIDSIKPTQYIYSLINNYNLRLKFGDAKCSRQFKKYLKALSLLAVEFEGAGKMLSAAYRKNKLKVPHFYLWKFFNRSDYDRVPYKFIGIDYEDRRENCENSDILFRLLSDKSIAVHAHIFYVDLVDEIVESLNCIPFQYDCYVSTDTEKKKEQLQAALFDLRTARKVVVEVFKNRGRDVAPFILQMENKIAKYDYVCHIHTKKSLVHDEDMGNVWRKYLYKHLFGNENNVIRTLENFIVSNSIGLIFPEVFNQVKNHLNWAGNKKAAADLMQKLGVGTELPDDITFPAGSMFWAKTDAIKSLITLGLTIEDFPDELGQRDETLAHAIERLWVYIAHANGYRHLEIMLSD